MKTTGFPELKYYFHVSQTELKIDNFKMVYNEKWVLDLMISIIQIRLGLITWGKSPSWHLNTSLVVIFSLDWSLFKSGNNWWLLQTFWQLAWLQELIRLVFFTMACCCSASSNCAVRKVHLASKVWDVEAHWLHLSLATYPRLFL